MKFAVGTLIFSTLLVGCGSGGGAGGTDDVSGIAADNATLAQDANTVGVEQASNSTSVVGNCELSLMDQDLLVLLNEVRNEARMCGDTFQPAVGPVVWNCDLEGAAEAHSNDMAENNFFSHTGSDGSRVGIRADEAGYNWIMVGENIAVGYSSVSSVMQGWLDSPSHCQTVMNGSYDEAAVSLVLPSGRDYSSYWTLLLGKRSRL